MATFLGRITTLFLAMTIVASVAQAVTYTATVLHRIGFDRSKAEGVYDGYQVGTGFNLAG
jgi:hypothetical protein